MGCSDTDSFPSFSRERYGRFVVTPRHVDFLCNTSSEREQLTLNNNCEQVGQLSQRERASGWLSFGRNISGRQYTAPNVVGARKLTALIVYTINPLLYGG